MQRIVKRTALVVGEGERQYRFFQHLQRTYQRITGNLVVTTMNAHDNGAANAVEVAIVRARAIPFDFVLALIDRSGDLDHRSTQRARARRVIVVDSNPCIEYCLLLVHGLASGVSEIDSREQFEIAFGGGVADDGVLDKHFDLDVLERSRGRLHLLDELLRIFGG